MANPFGDNMFNPGPAYGEVAKQMQLAKEAPISGAPIPGSATTSAPAAAGGPGPVPAGPMAMPFAAAPSGDEYYSRLANTWRALAASPGSSKLVKQVAKQARQRQQNVANIAQQIGG